MTRVPSISMFYGIIIYMYPDDHNPPHFHATYQGNKAIFNFDGEIIEGSIPNKQRQLVVAWTILHRDELEANWELGQNKQAMYKIEPLR